LIVRLTIKGVEKAVFRGKTERRMVLGGQTAPFVRLAASMLAMIWRRSSMSKGLDR